jgi:hypothetical protein
MAVGEDVAVAADSTERKWHPTAVLYNGVLAAQNIALRAYKDRARVEPERRRILRFCTASEQDACSAYLLPGTRRDQFPPVQDDVGQLVVAVCIFHRALAARLLNLVC